MGGGGGVKLHGKKKKLRLSAHSWHTYNIYVRDGFFLHKLEVIAVCHVYVTQSGLKRPFHETRDMSSEREFCCSLHVSVSLRK